LKNGHKIINLDLKENDNFLDNFNGNYREIEENILTYNRLNELIEEVDGIIHLAAISRVFWGHNFPELCYKINVDGTLKILEIIAKSKNKPWFIFGSSREVYGEPRILPVNENMPLIPINEYGKSKLFAELYTKKYSTEYGLRTLILRFSNVYGGLNDHFDRVIPAFILSALEKNEINVYGGKQIFDFTHVSDISKCILQTAYFMNDLKSHYFDYFHVVTGRGINLLDLISLIQKQIDVQLKINYCKSRSFEVSRFIGDPSKLKNELGFSTHVSVEEGLKRTIDIYKNNFHLLNNLKNINSNFLNKLLNMG